MDKLVSINIWDDYEDDWNISEGHTQKTYAYIESDGLLDSEQQIILRDFINTTKRLAPFMVGVDYSVQHYNSKVHYPTLPENMHFKRYEIHFEGLSHRKREKLIEVFKNADTAFNVYSES